MRKTCIDMVYELAKRDPRVVFIGSDLSPGLLEDMKKEMPGRHYMEGVSEANVIGMAAGMAMEGYIPYVNTIATFITRRCYEQVALDLCLHNLPVRLIGNGGGLVYAPLGPTHLAIEDIAIMRALPNMCVVSACDADEMKRLMNETLDWPGPIYIRLAKGFDPVVSSDSAPFKIGKGIPYGSGKDALIITTGVGLQISLKTAEMLNSQGIEITVLHLPTIKPLDREAILQYTSEIPIVVSVEEHTIIGGVGSAVLEVIVDERLECTNKFKRIGIPDTFAQEYGSQQSLMAGYGITAENISREIYSLINRTNHVKN